MKALPSLTLTLSVSLSCSLTNTPTRLAKTYNTAWRPLTHGNQPWPWHVLLHSAFELCLWTRACLCVDTVILWGFHIKWSCQALVDLMSKQRTVLVVFHTFVAMALYLTAAHSHSVGLCTHFFALMLQSLLKPGCFDYSVDRGAFILISWQFKRRLHPSVEWSERA